MYAKGIGTPQDKLEAYAWATIAEVELDGSDFEPEREARDLKTQLAKSLNSEEEAAGLNRAKELELEVMSFADSKGVPPTLIGLGIVAVLACIPVGLLLGANVFVGWAVRKIRSRA